MGEALLLKGLEAGEGSKDGVTIVGASAAVELGALLDDGLVGLNALVGEPAVGGGLLVKVAVHHDGPSRKERIGRGKKSRVSKGKRERERERERGGVTPGSHWCQSRSCRSEGSSSPHE